MGDEKVNWELILHRLDDMKEAQEMLNKKVDSMNEKLELIPELKNTVHDIKDWKDKLQEVISTSEMKDLKEWMKEMNEIVSVSQMKEMKDEVYKQKSKWTATIAIIGAIQVLMGILVTLAKMGMF